MSEVAVIRLGVGNTASVLYALERLGARGVLTDDPAHIADATRIILPGVGAAAHAIAKLRASGLDETLRAFKRPVLGVCLGQQLLYEHSEEGDAQGLGILPGSVTALESTPALPVPHMGWAQLTVTRESALLEGVSAGDWAYFVHSFACPIASETIATATYGASFSAIVARDNIFACQFHPERSGAVGARILANFLRLPC